MNSTVRQTGFSLVELVAVIVLLGIIGVGTISFIQTSVEAYREVTRRDEVAQVGRLAVERVSRELRDALPGSVRTSANCIEFVPVLAASLYTDLPIVGVTPAADSFSFINTLVPATASRAAVYPLSNADVYGGGNHLLAIDASSGSVSGAETTMDFSSSGQSFAEQSPARRIYFVDLPVSFCVNGQQLNRYSGYGYQVSQPAPIVGGDLLAEFIQLNDGGVVAPFQFTPGNLQRNGVVHLDFRFLARGTSDEWLRFSHDVSIRSVP